MNNLIIPAVIILLLLYLDITFTHVTLKLFRKLKPEETKWYEAEANPIGRWAFKKFGISKQSYFFGIVWMTAWWGFLSYVLSFQLPTFVSRVVIISFSGGAFFMLNYIHIINIFELLDRLKEKGQ